MKLPGAQADPRAAPRRPRDPGRGHRVHRADLPLRRARHPARARAAPASSCRRWRPTPTSCGTTGSATLDPDLYKDRSFEGAVNGKTVVITGASSGIGRAAALKIAAAGGIPILVARTKEKLDEVKAEIEAAGGTAYVVLVRPVATSTRSTQLVEKLLRRPRRGSTCSSTTPGRSIRRSVALSYDRFHDYERTVQLNYLGPVKLMLGAAAAHARPGRRPHRQRLLDRRADQPAALQRLRRLQGGAGRVHARRRARRRSATTSRSRRSTCRSCARR